MEYFRLNDHHLIPKIGCGTSRYGKVNGDFNGELNHDPTEVIQALDAGYCMFDTAIIYRNEELVAEAIKQCRIHRADIFIASKIDRDDQYVKTNDLVRQSIKSSLKRLDTDYIDLYLIHHPIGTNEDNLRVWRELEAFHKKGILKSIGVSNFTIDELSYLLANAEIKPTVNQIKSNPSNWNSDIIEYCKIHHILPQVYSPLRNINDTFKKVLENIGNEHHKTWAQILLRFHLDNRCQVIPMSYSRLHQVQNLDIFDFELSKEEFASIKKHQ